MQIHVNKKSRSPLRSSWKQKPIKQFYLCLAPISLLNGELLILLHEGSETHRIGEHDGSKLAGGKHSSVKIAKRIVFPLIIKQAEVVYRELDFSRKRDRIFFRTTNVMTRTGACHDRIFTLQGMF
jgi:hypothetical protein